VNNDIGAFKKSNKGPEANKKNVQYSQNMENVVNTRNTKSYMESIVICCTFAGLAEQVYRTKHRVELISKPVRVCKSLP
jgi:hypothetical protein